MQLTYLAVDSLQEGVGASQILPYMEGIARAGISVRLHTFEKCRPPSALVNRVGEAGVTWRPMPFGPRGTTGGLLRVLTGARVVRGCRIIHARSDLPAASALLSRAERWVWDVRSLYVDQKIELGEMRQGSPQEKVLRAVEHAAARESSAMITLTEAVLPVLAARHGERARTKSSVITTCVDLRRFTQRAMPPLTRVIFLLAGSLNRYYDVPLMTKMIQYARKLRPTELSVVTPDPTEWEQVLSPLGARSTSARPDEMPDVIAGAHVGLCVCRRNAGVSLTASMPTKIGEFLASGRPVIVNEGLGDADRLLVAGGCGAAIGNGTRDEIDRVLEQTWALVDDPDTPARCRALAEKHFDLDAGIRRLLNIYDRVASS